MHVTAPVPDITPYYLFLSRFHPELEGEETPSCALSSGLLVAGSCSPLGVVTGSSALGVPAGSFPNNSLSTSNSKGPGGLGY